MKKFLCVLCFLVLLSGCFEYAVREPDFLTAVIEAVKTLSTVNTASSPANPYAIPIGIGMAGLTAMLEALRRKERSGRKRAESELNSNGSSPKSGL